MSVFPLSRTESPIRVAIVGGGLSGLATAVQLQLIAPGIDVSLLEASDRVGGVIDTRRHGEFLVDYGADMFATQPPAALKLCQAIGVADRLIEPKVDGRGAMIVYRGRLVPIPDGFVLMRATKIASMITTPLLSISGKLRLLRERFVPKRQNPADESVAAFVRRRMGQEMLDRIVGPLVAGIYTADVERLSMRATMAPIVKMEQEYGSLAKATIMRRKKGDDSVERASSGARYGQFRAFPGGMVEFIESLRERLAPDRVRLSCPVTAMETLDARVTDSPALASAAQAASTACRWRLRSGETSLGEFDHVVLATPAAVTSRLVASLSERASSLLSGIETASTAIVVLGLRREDIKRPAGAFGFVVPPIERRRILAGSFASEKFAGRASEEHVIARVFIGGALQPELLAHDDATLVRIAVEELRDLIGLQGEPLAQHVVRWNHAMPQYHVGHLERVTEIERELSVFPSLSLGGNALHGVGIAPVIENAGKIARTIADRFVRDQPRDMSPAANANTVT